VAAWTTRFAVPDPVDLFGEVLAGALADRGIAVRDGIERARRPVVGRWTELARIATPLASVVEAMNTESNNACADQLLLVLGHVHGGGGTRAGGRAAVAQALQRLGVPADGLVQVDGSGLSQSDRVSAQMITALVDGVLRLEPKVAHAYVESFAVGGETGTLEKRGLPEGVRAKTGFIAGTSALSGLVDTRAGRTLVFSILVEYPTTDGLNTACWKPMQDSICKLLAGWDAD